MNSAGAAFSWQLWYPRRWAMPSWLAYLLFLGLAAQRVAAGAAEWRTAVFMWCIPLHFAAIALLAGFAFPEGDILSGASGYPARMLTLPVRTSDLVFWPMLYGAAFAAFGWAAFAGLILRPLQVSAPLLWPALLAAACMLWLQTIVWTPVGLRYARVLLALLAIPGMLVAVIQLRLNGLPDQAVGGLCVAAAAAAYAAAVGAVGLARQGSTILRPVPPRSALSRTAPARMPSERWFASPLRAQVWFEFRSIGLVLPVVNGVIFLACSLPFLGLHELGPLSPFQSDEPQVLVNVWLSILQSVLFLVPLLGACVGSGRRGEAAFPALLSATPVSPSVLVAARYLSAALSCLLTWAIVLAVGTGWLLLPARDGARTAPLVLLAWERLDARGLAAILLVLALLILWTWKCQIQSAWSDLLRDRRIATALPFVVQSLVFSLAFTLLTRYQASVRGDLSAVRLLRSIPNWLMVACALKATLAVWLVVTTLRTRTSSPRYVAGLGVGWVAAVAGLFAALSWLTVAPERFGPAAEGFIRLYLPLCLPALPPEFHGTAVRAAVSVLLVPFGRLLGAPLALYWNRRR